jgi:hypothetical protein
MNVGRDYFTLVAEGHVPALTDGRVDLTPGFVVDAADLKGALNVVYAAGAVDSIDITIGGTYAVGDEVKITMVSNATSRQLWRKTYTHIVEAGATAVGDIAAALNALIAADGEANETPYTSTVALGVITVVAKTDDKRAIQATVYTTSVAGTIAEVLTPGTISEGNPSDLEDKGVSPSDINLATYDTVRIKYEPTVAQPFIDMRGAKQIEIFLYTDAGAGAAIETLINGL